MKINRKKFWSIYRELFGKVRYTTVVSQLETLLGFIEQDESINTNIHHVSYMLATVHHETGWPHKARYSPIREGGRGRLPHQRKYGRPQPNGLRYYGRGYVQLTWDWNYKKMGRKLMTAYPIYYSKLYDDWLYDEPDAALDPIVSYHILSLGMRQGFFTGKNLSSYDKPDGSYDYRKARKIINGMDKARMIAGYAVKFEKILKESVLP